MASIFLTILTFLGLLGAHADDEEVIKKTKGKSSAMVAPKTWDNSLSTEYSPETEKQQDSNIYYYLDINYQPNATNRFRYFQRVAQTINPPAGTNTSGKVDVLNPRLMYYYNFTEPTDKSYHLALRLGTELGTSQASRDDGIQAISMVRLEFDKRFSSLTVSLRPYFAYWSTQYTADHLGEVLPIYTVGHNLYIEAKLSRKWSWDMELDTGFRMLQPQDVREVQTFSATPATPLETSKTALYFGTEFGYLATKSVKIRAGYYQFDKFVVDDRYALELFNNATTRYFIGLDYFF